jgi:hypothetical protein
MFFIMMGSNEKSQKTVIALPLRGCGNLRSIHFEITKSLTLLVMTA